MADKFATVEGDVLVIRVPFERMQEMLADVEKTSMLDYPVIVRDKGSFSRRSSRRSTGRAPLKQC